MATQNGRVSVSQAGKRCAGVCSGVENAVWSEKGKVQGGTSKGTQPAAIT